VKADTQLTKDIKARVRAYMEQKYTDEEVATFLNTASYLDPRFKVQYIDEASKDTIRLKLVEEGKQLSPCMSPTDNSQPSSSTGSPACSLSTQPDLAVPQKKMKLSDLFKKRTQPTTSISIEERIEKELDYYLGYSILDADLNPLDWWKAHSESCPTLAILAKKYLCACATSSPSERAFSTSGNILSPKRACLFSI